MPVRQDGTSDAPCRLGKKNTGDISGQKVRHDTKYPNGPNPPVRGSRVKRDGLAGITGGQGYNL